MIIGTHSKLAELYNSLDHWTFIPHGHCYLWKPGLMWLHGLSDGLIALAYFSIPVALIYFVSQRRDLPYAQIFHLFGAFIITCGLTHVMDVWTLWHPTYWVSGVVKAVTAFISIRAAAKLIPIIPQALTIPSRQELEQQVRDRTHSLQLSEERWQLALRGNNDGIWDWDVRTNEVFFSSRWKEMLGFADHEIENHVDEWVKRVHPDDLSEVMQTIQDHFARKTPFYISEHRIQCKDGSYKWILDRGQALWDEAGHVIRMTGSHTDITDRKQTQEALAKELMRNKTLLDTSIDGIVTLDHRGYVVQASSSFAQMIGYPMEETLTLHVANWDAQWSREELEQILQGSVQIPPQFETRHRRKDGSLLDVEISYSRVEFDGEMLHFCICRDISERKQTEAALSRLAAIVESSEDAIIGKSLEGSITSWNTGAEKIFGYTAEEAVGQPITILMLDGMLEEEKQIIAKIERGECIESYDTKRRRKDGSLVDLSISVSPIKDAHGQVIGASKIARDIRDRKHKEAVLQQAIEAAEAANLAKSAFLANMSHELRTPLNVILGFAQVMTHDASLTQSQQADLQTIQRSGDYLLSLINDVLDLSKIEAGHYILEETGFDLISLLHTLRTMMAERAKSKHLQLKFDIAPGVPQFVFADEQKLRQILLNLLSNAIKFTHQGSVTLRVTSQTSGPLCPALALSQNSSLLPNSLSPCYTLQFEVTDTGVGISTQEQSIIFDAFIQAEAGKKATSGTGLGLTISRKLLDLMHGEISVQSTPNGGSTFTVTIPVCPLSGLDIPLEQQNQLVIGLASAPLSYRILVVDDQPENRLVLVRLLDQLKLDVREATNGQEAIRIWRDWHPDLIWMDIRMPELDGYEATKQIRAMENRKPCIIIALTAQASQSDRTLALTAGCNDYISKPFREETLFLKLKEYLGLEYLYADSTTQPHSLSTDSSTCHTKSSSHPAPAVFGNLPLGWLDAVENAALCGDDRAIIDLAIALPPEFDSLRFQLTTLIDNFEFEQIIQLIHDK